MQIRRWDLSAHMASRQLSHGVHKVRTHARPLTAEHQTYSARRAHTKPPISLTPAPLCTSLEPTVVPSGLGSYKRVPHIHSSAQPSNGASLANGALGECSSSLAAFALAQKLSTCPQCNYTRISSTIHTPSVHFSLSAPHPVNAEPTDNPRFNPVRRSLVPKKSVPFDSQNGEVLYNAWPGITLEKEFLKVHEAIHST